MAKKSSNTPSVARKRAEAKHKQEERRRRMLMIGGGAVLVIAVIAAVLLLTREPEEPESPVTLLGDRPVAELEPLERVDYYDSPPAMTLDTALDYEAIVRLQDGGEMRLRLFDDDAPETVNNFVYLANQGFYDGTTFHRVIAGFMAQGGDPSGTGSGGPGYMFADETDNGLTFDRAGLLAMANAGPDTNGSQFFITYAPTPHLDGLHTIFGELVAGQEALDSITVRDPGTATEPGDLIESITIVESGG